MNPTWQITPTTAAVALWMASSRTRTLAQQLSPVFYYILQVQRVNVMQICNGSLKSTNLSTLNDFRLVVLSGCDEA